MSDKTYNIMAINPGHNGSMAFLIDGKVERYVEEERISRAKYDGNPYRAMIQVLEKYHVDELLIGGTGETDDYKEHKIPWTGENSWAALVRKYNPNVQITNIGNEHHLGHAASAFFNSGFEEAICIIADGAGSYHRVPFNKEDPNSPVAKGWETESIFIANKNDGIKPIYKQYGHNEGRRVQLEGNLFDNTAGIVKTYEAVTHYLGFGFIEAGKTMGLASYGKYNSALPQLFENGRGNKNSVIPQYPAGALLDTSRYPILLEDWDQEDPYKWHKDKDSLPKVAADVAYQIQKISEFSIFNLIKAAVEQTGIKNVVLAGGYGLNCVANYQYMRQIKDQDLDINFFVDPVSHDGGTALGLAKFSWWIHSKVENKEFVNEPLTTLYLGPQYDPSTYNLEQYEDCEITDVTPAEVAQMIADKNIITLYQGRSEAGPRALGNRSILYDPRDPEGKDTVNKVKGREWFRPFAGSMLSEFASDWFNMAGLKDSPYMMYAVDVKEDRKHEIPAITHVDGTCRIQTVTKEQNEHYYNLIEAFMNITKVPIVFNTSFNLAGEPLVETIEDAIHTLRNSALNYMYLPEIGKLVKCETNLSVKEDDANVEESIEEAA